MAKCEVCEREMTTANGCSLEWLIINSKKFKRIRVGAPGDFYEDMDKDGRCGDCLAKYGYLHHVGCDCEICPSCGGQLISCDCEVIL